MKNAFTVARRVILQILNDRRTLALLVFAPLLMVSLLWVIINSGMTKPSIAVSGAKPELLTALKNHAEITVEPNALAARDDLAHKKVDAALTFDAASPKLIADGADPSVTALSVKAVASANEEVLAGLNVPLVRRMASKMRPSLSLLHGSVDGNAFDFLAPVMMGFIIFFFVFILSGMSFLRERVSGTLERSLVSGAKRLEVILGYILGYGIFALAQTILIQAFIMYALGVPTEGSFWASLAINALLCLSALSLGGLVSSFAQTEFQVFQFIPIVILPQILFSGIFDLREAPAWVRAFSTVCPLTYAGDALRNVMLRGETLGDVWFDLAVLAGFIALFMGLNVLALRKTAQAA
jgi:ABC-2 type transport system permease protein